MSEQTPFAEYERRKGELRAQRLPPDEYERQCQKIAEELGI